MSPIQPSQMSEYIQAVDLHLAHSHKVRVHMKLSSYKNSMKKALDSHGVQNILVQCLNEQKQSSTYGRKLSSEEPFDSLWWRCVISDAIHANDQEVLRTVTYFVRTGVQNGGLDQRKASNLSKREKTKSHLREAKEWKCRQTKDQDS